MNKYNIPVKRTGWALGVGIASSYGVGVTQIYRFSLATSKKSRLVLTQLPKPSRKKMLNGPPYLVKVQFTVGSGGTTAKLVFG